MNLFSTAFYFPYDRTCIQTMEIQDSRTVTDFQSFTFSGHSRQHVLKSLSESIKLGHADYACFWSLELLCSGLVHSLWTTFFDATVQQIHRLCPNAILFVANGYEKFSFIEQRYSLDTMTDIRNRVDARELVCRTASVLAMCRKEKPVQMPRIKPEHDFTPQTIREMMKASTQHAASGVLQEGDPYELLIPMNEFCYNLRQDVRDGNRALYWFAWILKYCSHQKKTTKQTVNFGSRPNEYVADSYARHPVWFAWAAIWNAMESSPQVGTLRPYIEGLYRMHNLRWSPGLIKQRLPFLTCAVVFVCESNSLDFFSPANAHPSTVEETLEMIPRWLETIIQTRDGFSSR
jgi:hypothetical protein